MSRESFQIFRMRLLDELLESWAADMQKEVAKQSDDYILNVGETSCVQHLVSKFWIDHVEMLFDDAYRTMSVRDIPASQHPEGFDLRRGESYERQVFKYHIPLVGTEALLYYSPSYTSASTAEVTIEDGMSGERCVCFEIINFHFDHEKIDREADRRFNKIRSVLPTVTEKVDRYNTSLEGHARSALRSRKQLALRRHEFASSLKVPLRKRGDVPGTFSIPTPGLKKRVRIHKPEVTEKGYRLEPTLEQPLYEEILAVIHGLGTGLERVPSAYLDKGEEDLRDLFLLFLEMHFEGAATGETFNKSGKTDILIRHEGSNAFVAECKFWSGRKKLLDAIDQLLGYLTWRDSKAAIVFFVKNKDFSSVLAKVEKFVPEHPNYLRLVNKRDETWFDYRIHLIGDPNREVKVAIMLFHVPEK